MSLFNFRKSQKQAISPSDKKYIKKVSDATGWSQAKAKEEMDKVYQELRIDYAHYCSRKFYALTRPQQERSANKYFREKKRREKKMNLMCRESGLTAEVLEKQIRDYHALGITDVSFKTYHKFGMHLLNDDEVRNLLVAIADVEKRTPVLREKLHQIDKGELSYEDIQEEYREYLTAIEQTLTPRLRRRLTREISKLLPELKEDKSTLNATLIDMQMSNQLLQFTIPEYSMYHLYLASLQEKREYVNDRVRLDILSGYNSMELRDTINNKLRTYEALSQFFGRDVAHIRSMDDFDTFKDFVAKHPSFVCKPISESMGRGVELITVDPESDLRETLNNILEEKRTFLMEERIKSNEAMASFNEDSLNTVRLMAYCDGETARAVTGFMRTGRPGSFVDNAGAGGIYASVDVTTGILNSDGGDEAGRLYKEHPESHLTYKGFQIPNWEGAVQVGCDACKALGGTNFIGWDLALNDQNKWVIVEGNSFPQWVHQGPLLHGLKSFLIDVVGYQYE